MKYIIDHDLHIHSALSSCSRHPEQTSANLLNYAIKTGLTHICLTDHFWDSAIDGASTWYKPQDYAHISEALPLPSAEGIRFDFGCETDFNKYMTLGISHEKIENFDFIIVPTSHLHMRGFTIDESLSSVKSRAKYYMERNHALLDMDLPFEKMGLAHFTCSLLARNCDGKTEDILNEISDGEYFEFFERVATKGMGIELNTPLEDSRIEAIMRPYRIALQCGCKFYLGSDAHTPDELLGAHARFKALAESLNLTEDDKFSFAKS